MTDSQKLRLAELIEDYGTYQFMLGRDEEGVSNSWYLEQLKKTCEELRDAFGAELIDLTFLA